MLLYPCRTHSCRVQKGGEPLKFLQEIYSLFPKYKVGKWDLSPGVLEQGARGPCLPHFLWVEERVTSRKGWRGASGGGVLGEEAVRERVLGGRGGVGIESWGKRWCGGSGRRGGVEAGVGPRFRHLWAPHTHF